MIPVPYDPELEPIVREIRAQKEAEGHPRLDDIPARRAAMPRIPIAERIAERRVILEERRIPGADGTEIVIAIVRPRDRAVTGGMVYLHGGGMIYGDRFDGLDRVMNWVEDHGVVAVSPEYRLAPEHPYPTPSEDCYAALTWTAEHAAELGFTPDRLLLAGSSAGGGLAAMVAILARDRRGPVLVGQLLIAPMLDDREETVSNRQYDDWGPWNRTSNRVGWTALLGDRRGSDDLEPTAAPGRLTDFAGLPPAYLEVGSAELFRDEDVQYATGIWAAGGQCELHVWAGAFHGFELRAPASQVTAAALAARDSWFRRVMGY